ncbi:hypothetical protein OXX69_001484 [Metschnikowia pulcherrima]
MIYLFLILAFAHRVASLGLNLCSSTNLGGAETSYEFMSNGYCRDYCSNAGYTVAITQNYNCWCSTAVPESTVNSDSCDTGCPGYSEQEKCGGDGVYGYVVFGSASTSSGVSSSSALATSASTEKSSSARVSTFSSESTSSTIISSARTATSLSTSTAASSAISTYTSSSRSSSASSTTPSSSLISASSATSMSGTSQSSETTESSSAPSTSSSASQQSSPTSSAPSTSSSPESSRSSVSMLATTVVSVVTINGSVSQQVSTKYVTASVTSQPSSTQLPAAGSKNAFFDSSAKVAGTFTAVGVVVVALIATLVYCCCFAGGAHRDEYSDEEKQYSSDENSVVKSPAVPPDFGAKSRTSSHSNLKRNSSNKSIMSLFNGGASTPEIGRSQSRKKLNPKNEALDSAGPIMAPITEFDNALDPRAMFAEYNHSKLSLNDENDYSRRIWHVTNP